MELLVWLALLALCWQAKSVPVDPEEYILPYLRGIGWEKVEKELRKDFRLKSTILPISYDIHLNVSVTGYGGATTSTFDGYVTIALNSSEPKDTIELHSIGLTIRKAELILSSTVEEVTKIEHNREREIVIFTLARTVSPNDSAHLKVYYNGTATMRGYGLFEYWTKPEKKTPKGLPTISLATNCEPTGARRWFPSFDEPDKKATFRLTVIHPSELTAYSNTEGVTREIGQGVSETTFKPTVPLPTYLLALALTEQPATEWEYEGHKIRAIGRERYLIARQLEGSFDNLVNRPAFNNVTFFPEKTDWLIVEDGMIGAMENPGLITSTPKDHFPEYQVHELAHMYFGNLVTLRSWEQIWINEGFANYFQSGGHPTSGHREILDKVSMHDVAMHDRFSYTRSQFVFNQFFENPGVHYEKSGQLLRLIRKFIGEEAFDRALNRYLLDNEFGNGDSGMMINYLSAGNKTTHNILEDWVKQPGVVILQVEEYGERVVIKQRRFLRTDFMDNDLMDNITSWTIPVYYKINGQEHVKMFPRNTDQLVLDIPANATFSIDESFPTLYAVNYTNREQRLPPTLDLITPKLPQIKRNYDEKKTEQDKFVCPDGMSDLQYFEVYLIKKKVSYVMCMLKEREKADKFLRDLISFNGHSKFRFGDIKEILLRLNIIHHGILLDFLSSETENIDFLGNPIWEAISEVARLEEGGIEKIREIVRKHPSFAANFWHVLTRLFEEDYVENEMAKIQRS